MVVVGCEEKKNFKSRKIDVLIKCSVNYII